MLNYTQSGISRMIADLEKEWNVTLLERGKSGVKLTSDGMKLLPYVKNVCEEYGRFQTEIEDWIASGRVDCGFLRLLTRPEFESIFLERDKLLAVIPENHKYAELEKFPIAALCEEPFMLLEKGAKAEISAVFERSGLNPNVRFTTWDDYAVMSMVESGLGNAILPQLILKRVPYHILAKELDVPAYRDIGFVLKSRKTASAAVKRFIEYLRFR